MSPILIIFAWVLAALIAVLVSAYIVAMEIDRE